MPHLQAFLSLIRMNKPIGSFLLLWPTYWALWLASRGTPTLKWFVIFTAGVLIMRSAGCIINDLADKHWDGKVARTQHRPLVKGAISPNQAWGLFFILLLLAACLLIPMNPLSWLVALVAVGLTTLYPFSKRYTHYPQVILGFAWSTSVLLSFSAISGSLPKTAWLLYFAVVFWTIAFDAYYALADWQDDQKIGIRSIAVRFGEKTPTVALCCHIMALLLLLAVGQLSHLGAPYFVAWGICGLIALHQYYSAQCVIKQTDTLAQVAFRHFLNNTWIGVILWLGIVINLYLK